MEVMDWLSDSLHAQMTVHGKADTQLVIDAVNRRGGHVRRLTELLLGGLRNSLAPEADSQTGGTHLSLEQLKRADLTKASREELEKQVRPEDVGRIVLDMVHDSLRELVGECSAAGSSETLQESARRERERARLEAEARRLAALRRTTSKKEEEARVPLPTDSSVRAEEPVAKFDDNAS